MTDHFQREIEGIRRRRDVLMRQVIICAVIVTLALTMLPLAWIIASE
jgi:hypothetical protein